MARSRNKGQQIIFGMMGLIVVLSMVLGLIVTVIPEPKQPTPTRTIRPVTPLPTPPPRLTVTPQPIPTVTPTPTPTLTGTPISS